MNGSIIQRKLHLMVVLLLVSINGVAGSQSTSIRFNEAEEQHDVNPEYISSQNDILGIFFPTTMSYRYM